MTVPVNQHKEIKRARNHLTALIIVIIFLTMTAVLLLFGLKDTIKLDSTVQQTPSIHILKANDIETLVFD